MGRSVGNLQRPIILLRAVMPENRSNRAPISSRTDLLRAEDLLKVYKFVNMRLRCRSLLNLLQCRRRKS